jgi:PKD repeat protein
MLSFGKSSSGNSSRYDHYLGLSSGRVTFRMTTGTFGTVSVTSPRSYADRNFHQAVATFSPATGMALYVDGALVATNSAVTEAGNYSGYWRVGGDASSFFTGTLDDASVYPTVLSAGQVQAHFAAARAALATPPTASFTATANGLTVALDASSSSTTDGVIANYAWDFGDGSTGTGITASHNYAAAGKYLVRLTTTTSNGGIATTSQTVSVTVPNQVPVASFVSSCRYLACSFDGTRSADPDGTIASYKWDFGDGKSATGASPAHSFAASGSYQVKLTVTDNKGATGSTTNTVTVAANQAPVAGFTHSCAFLSCSFDGSSSSDADGSIAQYAWNFGDGTTASGATVSHDYAAPGAYTVTLTVTDDAGATGVSTWAATVQGATVYAADDFARTVTGGWGSADVGGSWSLSGGAAQFGVGSGVGTMNLSAPGATRTALLNAVSASDLVERVDVSVNAAPTGNGVSLALLARHTSDGDYRLKLRLLPGGVVHLVLSRVTSGAETILKEVAVAGVVYSPGDTVSVQFSVVGTSLAGKVWPSSGSEPASPQISMTDTTASLQNPGGIGVMSYLAGNSTVSPVVSSFGNLSAVAVGN